MKAKLRKEIPQMLKLAGNSKEARELREKFYKTGTLSKRDVNILWNLVAEATEAA